MYLESFVFQLNTHTKTKITFLTLFILMEKILVFIKNQAITTNKYSIRFTLIATIMHFSVIDPDVLPESPFQVRDGT